LTGSSLLSFLNSTLHDDFFSKTHISINETKVEESADLSRLRGRNHVDKHSDCFAAGNISFNLEGKELEVVAGTLFEVHGVGFPLVADVFEGQFDHEFCVGEVL
jgi:hypothetical protein